MTKKFINTIHPNLDTFLISVTCYFVTKTPVCRWPKDVGIATTKPKDHDRGDDAVMKVTSTFNCG